MTSAAYIQWCFKMAKSEEHHDEFRAGYLKNALTRPIDEVKVGKWAK